MYSPPLYAPPALSHITPNYVPPTLRHTTPPAFFATLLPPVLLYISAVYENGGIFLNDNVDNQSNMIDRQRLRHHGPSGYDPGCYALHIPNYGPGVPGGNLREKYFNIFSSRPAPTAPGIPAPGSPPSPGVPVGLYECWDRKYSSFFESITSKISAKQMFSSFKANHQEAVSELQSLIEDNMPSSSHPDIVRAVTFLEYLSQRRTDIHPQLLMHAIAAAEVTSNSPLLQYATPALPEIFPTKFFSGMYANLVNPAPHQNNLGECVKINAQWGRENGIENRLWYYREDVQLNMHHWTWHLHHSTRTDAPIERRGEIFYFFHHELVARYAAERLANGFQDYFQPIIVPYDNMPLAQGYDSNLRDGVSTSTWINRPNNTAYNSTTLDPEMYEILKQHKTWYDRVSLIADTGIVETETGNVMLIPDGINSIGELFEASQWGLNRFFYGGKIGWHNNCHNILGSLLTSSTQRNDTIGVLGDVSVAVRDMVFFRIHRTVNELFMKYKHQILKPYELSTGDNPLILPGIVGKSVSIKKIGSGAENTLSTYWNNKNMKMDGGLDFNYINVTDRPIVPVCVEFLDHEEFTYDIELENEDSKERDVFVRIFMAPRYKGPKSVERFPIEKQFPLLFTMDTFPQTLKPGVNTITRSSLNSTVTAPWWKSKAEMAATLNVLTDEPGGECTCGYPHHLLLPKGTEEGLVYDIVVVVTDGNDWIGTGGAERNCASQYIHCGLIGLDYPDKKPMGYPWDRKVNSGIAGDGKYLEDYIAKIPNMVATTVRILHDDTTPKEHVV